MSSHRATINERVVTAGDEVERRVRHDPNYHAGDKQRDMLFAKASDPNSDWPEPALKGQHLQDSMARWLPKESPKKHHTPKHHAPMQLDPNLVGGDVVSGINTDVGGFNTSLTHHGRHTGSSNENEGGKAL